MDCGLIVEMKYRVQGRFPPPLPCLPLRSFSLYANHESMLASCAGKGVRNPVLRRWKWPVLGWPQMAGFGIGHRGDDCMQKENENIAHAQDGIRLTKLKNSGRLRNSPTTGLRDQLHKT